MFKCFTVSSEKWKMCLLMLNVFELYNHMNVTCWVIFSHVSSSGCSKGVSSLSVSSLPVSSGMPPETAEMVETFLEILLPAEMPESAESFLVKCLPKMSHFSIIMSLHRMHQSAGYVSAWKWDQASADNMTHDTERGERRERHVRDRRSQVRNLLCPESPGSRPHSLCLTAQSERKVKLKAEGLTAASTMNLPPCAPCNVAVLCKHMMTSHWPDWDIIPLGLAS